MWVSCDSECGRLSTPVALTAALTVAAAATIVVALTAAAAAAAATTIVVALTAAAAAAVAAAIAVTAVVTAVAVTGTTGTGTGDVASRGAHILNPTRRVSPLVGGAEPGSPITRPRATDAKRPPGPFPILRRITTTAAPSLLRGTVPGPSQKPTLRRKTARPPQRPPATLLRLHLSRVFPRALVRLIGPMGSTLALGRGRARARLARSSGGALPAGPEIVPREVHKSLGLVRAARGWGVRARGGELARAPCLKDPARAGAAFAARGAASLPVLPSPPAVARHVHRARLDPAEHPPTSPWQA